MENTENTTASPAGAQPTQKDAFFFLNIIGSMKNKPDVDWEVVAQKSGYNNGGTAKTRFGQIKKKLGFTEDGGASAAGQPKTPTKPRAKKEKTVGSGTNGSASKVVKKRTPKKEKAAKVEDEKFDTKEEPQFDDSGINFFGQPQTEFGYQESVEHKYASEDDTA